MEKKYLIMHKGKPHEQLYFNSLEESRNWLKWAYPKRRFKESSDNLFVCCLSGAKFEIISVIHPTTII